MKVDRATQTKVDLLRLSREIPMCQCSPYGDWTYGDRKIKISDSLMCDQTLKLLESITCLERKYD